MRQVLLTEANKMAEKNEIYQYSGNFDEYFKKYNDQFLKYEREIRIRNKKRLKKW